MNNYKFLILIKFFNYVFLYNVAIGGTGTGVNK